MLNKIIKTNPAPEWATRDFRCQIKTVTGHTIQATFKGNKTVRYDYEHILTGYAEHILTDPLVDYGEYLCVASLLATKLNNQIWKVQREIIVQTEIAENLIGALSCEDYSTARRLLSSLGDSLEPYGKEQVKSTWSKWTMNVVKYLDSRNPSRIDEMM